MWFYASAHCSFCRNPNVAYNIICMSVINVTFSGLLRLWTRVIKLHDCYPLTNGHLICLHFLNYVKHLKSYLWPLTKTKDCAGSSRAKKSSHAVKQQLSITTTMKLLLDWSSSINFPPVAAVHTQSFFHFKISASVSLEGIVAYF